MTRAFVIGNGISLQNTNLDLMKDEVTFGMNRIHLLYDTTEWRPTYWVYTDIQAMPENMWIGDCLFHIAQDYECFIWSNLATMLELKRTPKDPWAHDKVTYIRICSTHVSMNITNARRPDAWHLPELCKFGTGAAVALQLAVLGNHNPIYVVGMDLGFKHFNKGDPDPNHFTRNYLVFDGDSLRAPDATTKNSTHNHAHQMAFAAAKERGIDIFNATIGGELEAYPRVNYEELFNE